MKRIFAALLAAALCLTAGAALAEVPETQFATTSTMKRLSGSGGPLAAGVPSDRVLRIQFGVRPNKITYPAGAYSSVEIQPGPITWLLAGMETDEHGVDKLVLYSEAPLIGVTAFDADSNRWETSDLREALKELATDPSQFAVREQDLMVKSVIRTPDPGNGAPYETRDTLYAPAGNFDVHDTWIQVGEKDQLRIDRAYWAGSHWLRSPHDTDEVLGTYIRAGGNNRFVIDYAYNYTVAAAAATALDAGSVLFASAASAGTDENGLAEITDGAPMTLRLGTNERPGEARVSQSGDVVNVTGAEAGTRLMIQGDGWAYWAAMTDGSAAVTMRGIKSADGGDRIAEDSLHECRVWLEWDIDNGGTLTYARMAGEAGENDGGEDGSIPAQAAGEMPQTGDPSSLTGWACLLAASGAAMVFGKKKTRGA